MPSTLAYWDTRGLAHPIRMLLRYAGEEFEDKRLSVGPAPEYSKEHWHKMKHTLGYTFPNLPYYTDGKVKITHTNAIIRYIAHKYNLCGDTDDEQVQVDVVAEQVVDFCHDFVCFCYQFCNYPGGCPTPLPLNEYFAKVVPGKMKTFEDYLGDKEYLMGSKITYPDFTFFEMLDQHNQLDSTCLDNFPKLQAYHQRFKALPAIKAFLDSPESKLPLWNRYAKYGCTV